MRRSYVNTDTYVPPTHQSPLSSESGYPNQHTNIILASIINTILTYLQIIHYTSFEEMKKRKEHCLTYDEEPAYIDMELQAKLGGFFRHGQH